MFDWTLANLSVESTCAFAAWLGTLIDVSWKPALARVLHRCCLACLIFFGNIYIRLEVHYGSGAIEVLQPGDKVVVESGVHLWIPFTGGHNPEDFKKFNQLMWGVNCKDF